MAGDGGWPEDYDPSDPEDPIGYGDGPFEDDYQPEEAGVEEEGAEEEEGQG